LWLLIKRFFEKYPARMKVAKLIFERGFQVKPPDKIVSGSIEIPHVQIAKEVGVDRRTVRETAKMILENPELRNIFQNLRQVCFLKDVAKLFNWDVIIYVPKDAKRPRIVAEVTQIISRYGLNIRQIIAEDPDLVEEPKLYIIIEGKVPPEVITELKHLPITKSIIIQ